MMFEPDKIYRHNRSMDVDIYVFSVVKNNESGIKLRVMFISRPSRRFIAFQEVLVTPEHFSNWKEVDL